ncbi:MAG: threonylcarbamoyladenosine tRNA methylthiotransferase [Thermoplasmata archaeon]|nr:MAG: threonylcarbamoyladenosine tRNA methylthiotransferase [Thermoplasmata archaeon]
MKAYIETYGCTANKSDASIIKGILKLEGYNFVNDPKDADIIIILTCTVIASTEQRMLFRISKLREYGKKLVVAGCMASVQADLVKRVAPESFLLPPGEVYRIAEIAGGRAFERKSKTSLPRYYEGVVAPIAISEGCSFSCTYCITSKARGRLKSFPKKEIVSTAKEAIEKGCKEIQLTAQDLSSYGMDSGERLKDLVEDICNIEGDFMIRLGMMNPRTARRIVDDLVEIYRNEKVYKFLHLPVQSGDDSILERMERGYKSQDFIDLVEKVREEIPELTLSTDIIVAFPGEDEDAFMRSVELIKKVEPDIVNITRFSPRAHTKARLFKDRIPTHVAKERSRFLTEVCKKISFERNKKYVDKCFKVLLTEKGKGKTTVGRTFNYKPVVLPAELQLGKFVYAKAIEARQTYLLGSLVS